MSRNEAFNSGHNKIVARLSTGPEHAKHWALSSDDFENPTISSHATVDLDSRTQAHIRHSTPAQIGVSRTGKPVYDKGIAHVALINTGQDEPFHEFNAPVGLTLRSAITGTVKAIYDIAQGRQPVAGTHPGNVREWFPWATEGRPHKLSVQFKPEDVEAHATKVTQEAKQREIRQRVNDSLTKAGY